MDELKGIIETAIYQQLRPKLIGKLSVFIRHNSLLIKLHYSDSGIDFEYLHITKDIAGKLVQGVSTSNICTNFMSDYTSYVHRLFMNKFFK